jgi:putative transposase
MADRRPLTSVSEAARARALDRFQQLVQPHLEDGVPLARVAAAHGIPVRSARRWLQAYQQHGLSGLVRPPRADRGRPRRVTPACQQLIEGLALQRPPPTAAQIHRQLSRVATEQGWSLPS